MTEFHRTWIKKIKPVLNMMIYQKTIRKARITYQVFWNLFLLFLMIGILAAAFACGMGAGYFASLVKNEPVRSYSSMKKDIYNYSETTNLYFDHHVYLGKLRSDLDREEVKLEQVSDYLKKAIVATEDEYFYQHKGIVPKAVFRAVYQELANSAIKTGGSTLTQQLIKNQLLTNEVSFRRKASEILLALRLERFFSKKEILEAYLNVTTFGRNSSGKNIAGIQAAAKGIFGKEAKDLTLPEAAFIAGLPQSPFGYTPFTKEGQVKENLTPSLERMKSVLKRMLDGGSITQKQYAEASAYNIRNDFVNQTDNSVMQYPWLTTEIEKRSTDILSVLLAKKDGYTEQDLKKDKNLYNKYQTLAGHDLHQKGYEIHTTIHRNIYDAMQKAKDRYPFYGPDKPQEKTDPETREKRTIMEPVEVGAELIENKTGKIISFVGGRDYGKQQLNHATSAIRQNGSTMKPLLVYGPAIELGVISPGTPLPDVALSLNPASSTPWPHNYDLRYNGLVPARYALAKSYNVPAVKLYSRIVNRRPAKYLEKMGFTSLRSGDYTNLATAIGSLEDGVTVEENTNAFTTFANGGKFIDAYLIEEMVDKNGKTIYHHKANPVEVFTPQTSYLTLDMMRDVIKMGTASQINEKLKFHTDWAGKTGTGVDYYDSWFVAANPNVTFGIWTGYDTPKSLLASEPTTYSQRTNNLWANLINSAYDADPALISPKESFQIPHGIVKVTVCAVSGLLPSRLCKKAGLLETDYFNAKYVPSKQDDSLIERNYVQIGGEKYLALDSTPLDMAQKGIFLNPDFITRMVGRNFKNIGQLIPQKPRWANILLPDAQMSENGKRPDSVSLTADGHTLKWSASLDNDVIGYRVYERNLEPIKVASIKSGTDLSSVVSEGTYYVTAVDISGNESAPSNEVVIGTLPIP